MAKKILILIGLISLLSSLVTAISLDDPDLVAYWKMDDSGTIFTDSKTNANPPITLHYDGALQQATAIPTFSTYSVGFDGVDDELVNNSALTKNTINTLIEEGEFTVGCWVKASGDDRAIFGFRESTNGFNVRFAVDTISATYASSTIDYNVGGNIDDTLVIFKVNTTHCSLWANDSQVAVNDPCSLTNSTTGLYLGALSPGLNQMDGKLDECFIIGRSLTSAEINEIYLIGFRALSGEPLTPTFVSPTPTDNDINNSNQTINVTHSGSDVGFYLWVNDSLYVVNESGDNTGDGNLYFNWTTNFSDGSWYYSVGIFNRTNHNFSNNISRTLVIGSIAPTVTLNENNLFDNTNTSIVYTDFGWLNITLTDDSDLDSFLINITDEDAVVKFNFTNESLTGTVSYNFIYNLSLLPFGNGTYFVDIFGSDTHTALEIDDYRTRTENRKIFYDTAEGNHIEISVNEDATTKTTKQKDRYDFEFNFADRKTKQRTFTLKSSQKIKYINNSKYKAHFITKKNIKEGNWIDFEGVDGTPIITKINDREYQIVFDSVSSNVKFNSIGGLNIVHESYQFDFFTAEVTLAGRSVLTGSYVDKLNMTITDVIRGNVTSSYLGTNNSWNISNLRAGVYNINITHLDGNYLDLNTSFEITTNPVETFIFNLSFLSRLNLFDERNLEPFNVSSPTSINFLQYCPTQTIQTTVNETNGTVAIGCEFTKFKIVLNYDDTSYYRTFIYDYSEMDNVSIYLIDLDTTTSVYNSFILDDLLQNYDNPSIFVKKTIGGEDILITSDYIDIENKIGAYLIENHEYTVEVHSDNNPVRVMGVYSADSAGDKNLRLYDIGVYPGESLVFDNTVTWSTGVINDSGNYMAFLKYADTENLTTSLNWSVYQDSSLGALLYSIEVPDFYNIEYQYDVSSYINSTLVSVIAVDHPGLSEHSFSRFINTASQITLSIMSYINQQFMNWFLTLFIGIVALMATIRTANIMNLSMIGLASLFVIFGWFTLTWGILVLAFIVSIISFLKSEDRRVN